MNRKVKSAGSVAATTKRSEADQGATVAPSWFATSAAAAMRGGGRAGGEAVLVLVVIFGALLLWEAVVWIMRPSVLILPPPSLIAAEIANNWAWYLRHATFTFNASVLGFVLAVVVGIMAAIGIVYSRILEHTLFTLLVSFNSIPKIALAPLFVIWLSTGLESKVAIAALIAVWPIVVDSVLGMRSLETEVNEMARSMRASAWDAFWKLRFPNALPSMFAGMKVAVSMALVGTIAGEFVASERGLGYAILVAQGQLATEIIFACLVLLGLMGALMFFAVVGLERMVLWWHVSQR